MLCLIFSEITGVVFLIGVWLFLYCFRLVIIYNRKFTIAIKQSNFDRLYKPTIVFLYVSIYLLSDENI